MDRAVGAQYTALPVVLLKARVEPILNALRASARGSVTECAR